MTMEDIMEVLMFYKRMLDDMSFCYIVNGYIEMCKLYIYYVKLLTN